MAKKVIIDLEANTSKAQSELNDIVKELKALNQQAVKTNETLETGLKDVEKSAKDAGKGFLSFSNILKGGLIITVLNKAFEFFKETIGKNQVVIDAFAITFETLSIAFNDFFGFLSDNVGTVIDYFKQIFENPGVAIRNFGKMILNNIIERFNSLIDALGFAGEAIGEFFKGNFDKAAKAAKKAGKELVDVATGVDGSYEKIKEGVKTTTESITSYVKSTTEAAAANIKLQKTAEKARVLNQGLIEDYDRQAELLRQTRDDEFKTIDQRIKANNDLKAVLEQQKEAMLDNADAILAAAQAQFDKNGNDANAIALQEAKNEKAAIEAQITGFMSEQDANRNALLREKLELEQSNTDAATERAKVERDFNAEQIENDVLRIQKQQENLETEKQQELERLEAKRDSYIEGTQAYADAENERLAFVQEIGNKEKKLSKELADAQTAATKKNTEDEIKLAQQKQQAITNVLGNLASIVGQNTKFGKAIAVVQAIRDTFAGANKALSASPPPFNFIAAAAVTAAGIANVRSITSSQDPNPPSFAKGGGGAGTAIPTPSAPPAFNVVGASGVNQLATAIGQQQQQPMKAFVVSGDVSTAQELDRNIIKGAAIG